MINEPACPSPGVEPAAPRDPEDEDPAATVRSIAAMLGWENVPPRRILEMEIAAMKARIKSACGAASQEPKVNQ